jgi:hypothetical protein
MSGFEIDDGATFTLESAGCIRNGVVTYAQPPRKPPTPPAKPVKLGGNDDDRRLTAAARTAIVEHARGQRPHFADDIDTLVNAMVARGEVKLVGDVYQSGAPWTRFKWELNR